jgi:quinol monooxygenase YgiN
MFTRFVAFSCLGVLISTALWSGPPAARAGDKDDAIVAFAKKQLTDTTKPFTLVVVVKVKEGAGEKFETAFAKALVATRKEKGCIAYDLNRDSKDAKRYVVYERWKSVGDLAAHLKADYIRTLLEALPDLTEGAPELRILLPAAE